MGLPAVGSTVKILKTGEFGLVQAHRDDGWIDVSVVGPRDAYPGKIVICILQEGDYEVKDNAEVQPTRFHIGQSVTVDINGKPWTGRIAMVPNGDRYVVDLLVEFHEDDLTPFVITKPGH